MLLSASYPRLDFETGGKRIEAMYRQRVFLELVEKPKGPNAHMSCFLLNFWKTRTPQRDMIRSFGALRVDFEREVEEGQRP
jgi:hypothetical protein